MSIRLKLYLQHALISITMIFWLHGYWIQCHNMMLSTSFYSVDGNLNVKVADLALAHNLFPDDYECLGSEEPRPIKWMALESLIHRKYTEATDTVCKIWQWYFYKVICQKYVEFSSSKFFSLLTWALLASRTSPKREWFMCLPQIDQSV